MLANIKSNEMAAPFVEIIVIAESVMKLNSFHLATSTNKTLNVKCDNWE